MNKRNVHIDRLEIRFKGVSPEAARAASGDIGRDLLAQLSAPSSEANESRCAGEPRANSLDRLDAGTLRVGESASPSSMREQLARQLAASIKSKLG